MDQPEDMDKQDRKPQETLNDSAKGSRHVKKAIPEGGSWTEVHTQVLKEQRMHLSTAEGSWAG